MLDLIKTTYDSSNESWSILQLIELYPQIFSKLMGKSNEFSLLVPTAESLASFNITNSFDKLIQFIEFHIIPNAELDKMLGCISQAHTGNFLSIRTNYSDTTLNCRTESGKTILQLNSPNHMLHSFGYNKDHEVHIVNHGCTRGHGTGCVFLIDKPLNLAWLEKPSSNFLHVSLGIVSLGIGIIFGLVIFGIVMLGVAMCVNNKQKQMGGVITTGGSDFLSGGRLEPSFMSVRDSSDDNIYDRGYETDDDMLRSEHEQLLPTENRRRGSRRSFGASSVGGKHSYGLFLTDGNGSTRESSRSPTGPTGPLPISSKSITNTLNRERNLPGVV